MDNTLIANMYALNIAVYSLLNENKKRKEYCIKLYNFCKQYNLPNMILNVFDNKHEMSTRQILVKLRVCKRCKIASYCQESVKKLIGVQKEVTKKW